MARPHSRFISLGDAASLSFALLSTALVAAFINMEKASNDTVVVLTFRNLRVCGGCAA